MLDSMSKIRKYIQKEFDEKRSWDNIKQLKKEGQYVNGDREVALKVVAGQNNIDPEFLTIQQWEKIVDEVQKETESTEVIKLSKRMLNDTSIPTDPNSTWCSYQKSLEEKGWNQKSVDELKKSSFEIVQQLSMDTTKTGATKGLVIGNVQSGKTANMAGVMAMAADNGFNFFIILSGVIENLREQTSNRLYTDMKQSGRGNLHWTLIDKPTVKSSIPTHDISRFNLGENDKDRYFTVCLKNKNRLQSLINWLYSDKKKAEQLKILVIDDEADQASINTNKIDEEDATSINRLIKELVNSREIKGINYISYTATPYANVLNETDEESLYPKDFIMLLNPSDDYIGPKQIFGTELPETQPYVDITRKISKLDAQVIEDIHKGDSQELPDSFKKSIHWFILAVAIMRSWEYRKPISMLVHTSFSIDNHKKISDEISDYLLYCKANYDKVVLELEKLYREETIEFSKQYFIEGLPNYSNPEQIRDYPTWSELENYLRYFFDLDEAEYIGHINIGEEGEPVYHKGIHLVIDNSKAKAEDQIVRLVYPKEGTHHTVAPAFIVVGGNTLSRGLTIEGLVSTFFLRKTNQADTLMQMGRWFGFRKGYELLPRVWLENTAIERYKFLSQMNEELREEIKTSYDSGMTPIAYAPRIKNSYNQQFIRVTSNNKMQSAQSVDFDFSGFNSQTVYFENNLEKLQENLNLTSDFLNSLPNMEIDGSKMIWRDINREDVNNYLEKYLPCDSDIKMKNLSALIKWVEKNSDILGNWSVVLSGTGEVKEITTPTSEEWNINGYTVGKSNRTKKNASSTDKIIDIGSLRSPADLLADIPEELLPSEKKASKSREVQLIRKKYDYDGVPQLIIYRINKQTDEKELNEKANDFTKNKRSRLDFPEDIIGINIMIPGNFKGRNRTTLISAKCHTVNEDIEEN